MPRKWTRADYQAMIGLKKKTARGIKKMTRKLNKSHLKSAMLANLLGKKNKNAQQRRAIAATLSKSQMNGMGVMWKKFLASQYPLPNRQIKQLIRDKKLVDSFFNARIPTETRRRILTQKGGDPTVPPAARSESGSWSTARENTRLRT